MNRSHRKQSGFTIIEMLLVLATAGLILLVVLMAMPALQRNSRSNQRKQDVQIVLESISKYQLNNSGNIPNECNYDLALKCTTFLQNAKLSFYEPINVGIHPLSATNPTPGNITSLANPPDQIQVYNYHKCEEAGSSPIATTRGAGYFDIVAIYNLDRAGGGYSSHCQQL